MKKRALFVISTDPRSSGRPAEAIRIAAGVGVLRKVDVSVCFCGAAVLLLGEETDGFKDEENIGRYLSLLEESNFTVFAEKEASLLGNVGKGAIRFEPISKRELAHLSAQQTYLLRF